VTSLEGLRIAVTRPLPLGSEGEPFLTRLEEKGAVALHHPLTKILPPTDPEPLRAAARSILGYDWVILTSSRAVAPLRDALESAGLAPSSLAEGGVRICAVGTRTGAALSEIELPPNALPDSFSAEGIVELFLGGGMNLSGVRVLLPRAEDGRDLIRERLEEEGAVVDVVPAYRNVARSAEADRLARFVSEGAVDVLTFTAGSAARAFANGWRRTCQKPSFGAGRPAPLPEGLGVFVLGPPTAEVAGAEGIPVHGIAEPHTVQGLIGAIERWVEGRMHAGKWERESPSGTDRGAQ
jgi:uroporphyrinogen-III synthase